MDCVAFEDAAIAAYPTRSAWDASAAEIVGTMLDRWHLTAGEAYVGGEAASVLRVTTRDGTPAVLKVGFPHVEGVAEALGLESWGPALSPRVLRQDPWTWSLLLDHVEPGIPLSTAGVDAAAALDIAAGLFSRLTACAIPAGVPTLPSIVGDYLASARERLRTQHAELAGLGIVELVERGLDDAADLARSDRGEFFLHGDFNPGNILSAGADRWLVIDPKPMRGDREFDLWPLVEQLGSPWTRTDPAAALAAQLRRVTDAVGCDYERAARWSFARAALNVSWYVDDGNHDAAATAAAELRVVERISAP